RGRRGAVGERDQRVRAALSPGGGPADGRRGVVGEPDPGVPVPFREPREVGDERRRQHRRAPAGITDRVLDDDPHPAALAISLPNRSRNAVQESRVPPCPGTITQVTPAAASAAMASLCLPQSASASCTDGSVYAAATSS